MAVTQCIVERTVQSRLGRTYSTLKVGTFVHPQGVSGHPKIKVCIYIFHTLSQDRN